MPLVLRGTPFQESVWNELLRIPYGSAISYEELAARIRKEYVEYGKLVKEIGIEPQ